MTCEKMSALACSARATPFGRCPWHPFFDWHLAQSLSGMRVTRMEKFIIYCGWSSARWYWRIILLRVIIPSTIAFSLSSEERTGRDDVSERVNLSMTISRVSSGVVVGMSVRLSSSTTRRGSASICNKVVRRSEPVTIPR